MKAKNMIKESIHRRGMTLAELSRRTGIPYHRVRKAVEGDSRIMANDFLLYCKVLDIEVRE